MRIAVAFVTAFVIAGAASWMLARVGASLGLLDRPNARSLHDSPTPRSGGLAIWSGIVIGVVIAVSGRGVSAELTWITAAALLVGIVSLIDDRSHVPQGLRLLIQSAAAALLIAAGLTLDTLILPGFSIELSAATGGVLTLILVVWLVNLYNFMDGIDGFAAGMAVIGFGMLGLLGLVGGDLHFATLCWIIAAAAGGFLVWNFPPARLFMGDHGASVLGLLAAAMSLWADRLGLFPLWIGLLVFSPFVVDATVTLIQRLSRGERVWLAHRSHCYQRLARAGWGHRRTVLGEYALMLSSGLGALIAVRAPAAGQWIVLGVAVVVYTMAIFGVRRIEARRRN